MRKQSDGEIAMGCGIVGCAILFYAGWIVFLGWAIITIITWLTQQTL